MQNVNIVNKSLSIYCGVLILFSLIISCEDFKFIDALYIGIVIYYFIRIKIILKKNKR